MSGLLTVKAAVQNTRNAHHLAVILAAPALQIPQVSQVVRKSELQGLKEPLRLLVRLWCYPDDPCFPDILDRKERLYQQAIGPFNLRRDRCRFINPVAHSGEWQRVQRPGQESTPGKVLVAHNGLQHGGLHHEEHS